MFSGVFLIRRKANFAVVILLFCLMEATCFAHYPYPLGGKEKQAAELIKEAVENKNQYSVVTLGELLDDENPRIQIAALIGVMRLSNEKLDFDDIITAIGQLKPVEQRRANYLPAAAQTTKILLDKQIAANKRIEKLIKMTKSEDGTVRRMAVEALRPLGDKSVLKALEGLANDSFGTIDDSFDMKDNATVAFNVWWPIRSKGLSKAQKLPVLIDTLKLGEPYGAGWCDAACKLIEKEGKRAVALLLPIAKNGDRRSKLWARRTLKDIGGKKDISALIDFCVLDLDAKDQLLRQSAAYAISQLADKRILPELSKALKNNPDPHVRERIAAAMGLIDDNGTVQPLKAALKDTDDRTRTQAAAQLAKKGFSDGDAVLLESLEKSNGTSASIAAGSMSFIKDKKKLAKRIVEILEKQPKTDDIDGVQRHRFREVRTRILRELSTWDTEKLQPMAGILKPGLEDLPQVKWESRWRKRVLQKMEQ